jgi:ribonuclease BN (tRNA processing enzyme)
MIVKFWGTRGSIPVPGKGTLKYGGNTPCVEIRSSENKLLILDGGSGIRELGKHIVNSSNEKDINIFISHYHWDHIQGIPFFMPLFNTNNKVTFYGISSNGLDVEKEMQQQMHPNNFPISLEEFKADLHFKEIDQNIIYNINGFKVETFILNHPSPTLTFKITENNACFIYMTDNELNIDHTQGKQDDSFLRTMNQDLISFCKDCDYLVHDAMFEETSMLDKKGWGHSSNVSLAQFSIMANIKNLVLFHYNPDYDDTKIDIILKETQLFLKKNNSEINCIASKEGLEIRI